MPGDRTWTRPEIHPGDYPVRRRPHIPRRGDDVERWLTDRLQAARADVAAFGAIGAALLEYQRCGDAGDPLPVPVLSATDLDGSR